MSSLLPVVVPAARGRTDAAPDRRSIDAPNEGFAESLASARTEDAQRPTDDAAVAKASRAARQRAELQALMLSASMKFAVTRHDAPRQTADIPFLVASLPAAPDTDVDESATADADVAVIATADDASAVPSAIATAEVGDPVAARVEQTESAQIVRRDVATAASLPELYRSEHASPDRVGDAWPGIAPTAASMAAMQLLATLPLPMPAIVSPDAPDSDATDSGATESDSIDGGRQRLQLGMVATSLPDRPFTTALSALVEDHFDAPGASLASTPQTAVPMTAPVTIVSSAASTPHVLEATTPDGAANSSAVTGTATSGVTGRGISDREIVVLDPAFRERLDRVIERMRAEFGHNVTVVETVRSQARQNALFAQGRTTAGPVVTWTRNSKHGQGLAADLLVDGAWDNPVGYAHLAAIAKQEGLRTLGTRDPGHVELAGKAGEPGVSSATLEALLGDLQGDATDGARQFRADASQQHDSESSAATMARVANVAQVARVAVVASVAKVASVARPGESSGRDAAPAGEAASPLAVSSVVPMAGTTDLAGSVRVAAPVSSMSMADRISQLMDLQATQASKPLSSVMLRMENAGGSEDQIRIDTRGTSVEARLGLGNAQQLAAMTDRLGELREALERRGLTADSVRVQSTAAIRTTDSATFSRGAGPVVELAAMRAASDTQAQGNMRDQSTRDQQQREAFARDSSRHTPRSSSDDTRHRSRREQPEDRR